MDFKYLILEATYNQFVGECRDANGDKGNWMVRVGVMSSECKEFCSNLEGCEAYHTERDLAPEYTSCVLHCPTCARTDANSLGFSINIGTSAGPIAKGNGLANVDCYTKQGTTIFQ